LLEMPALKRAIPDGALLDLYDGRGLRPTARAYELSHETLRRAAASPEGKARTVELVRKRRKVERERRAAEASRRAEQKAERDAQRRAKRQRARSLPERVRSGGGSTAIGRGRHVPPLELEPFSSDWYDWYAERRDRSYIDRLNCNDASRGTVPPLERRARERVALRS
jgi:hypothetical protein